MVREGGPSAKDMGIETDDTGTLKEMADKKGKHGEQIKKRFMEKAAGDSQLTEKAEMSEVSVEKKEIKDIVPGDWMNVDNMEVVDPDGSNEYTVDQSNNSEEAGKYDSNNSVIVFVTPNGEKFVGPQTEAQLKALEEAGYERSSMGVPMSNGEEPKDERQRDLWRVMIARGFDQVKKENEKGRKAEFREAAGKE